MKQNSSDVFIEREVYREVLNWLEEPEIIAITGPRQSGKTTLLKKIAQNLKKVVFVDFEDTAQLEAFIRSPQTFVELHLEGERKVYFLFDEFQYVKNGGKVLKLLFDQFPQAKFIVTGSSSLKIREIASFLVGRVVFFNLYPLSFSEYLSYKNRTLFNLWKKFNEGFLSFIKVSQPVDLPPLLFQKPLEKAFFEYLTFGGYPAVVLSSEAKKKERLEALIETYIEKDIIRHLQLGNFLEFRNFVKILASQIGNLVNYSSLAADSKLSFRETRKFLGILEETFVAKLIYPFYKNLITELKKSPKAYFVDLGLRNALISDFREFHVRGDKGAVVENFVFQNLFYRKQTEKLNFWRTKQGAEVDFCLEMKGKIVPLEVKYQSFKQPKFSRSLSSFLGAYSPPKAVILTRDFVGISKKGKTKALFLPVYFI